MKNFPTPRMWQIYKSGDKSEIGNYRPINNNFATLFDKCLKGRHIVYLQMNNVLKLIQFGFIGGAHYIRCCL